MKRNFVGRVSNESLYSYFLSVRVHLSMGKNVTTAMFDNIKYIRDRKLKKILTEIRYDMFMNGTAFSDAFKVYEKCFPPEIVPLLSMGEATGTMEVAVKSCESLLDMRVKTSKAIKGEMAYPVVICIFCLLVICLLLFVIAPLTSSILQVETDVDFTSLGSYLLFAVLGIIFLVVLAAVLSRFIEPVGQFFHMVKLYLPLYGAVERAKVTAIFTLCLDSMMKNGLSGLLIYDMLMRIVPNKYVKANLAESYGSLLDGVSIDICLRTTKGFSEFFYTIPISAKAVSPDGKSPLAICAEFSEREMRDKSKIIVMFIQPIMMLILAGAIAGLFASVYLPYLESMQSMIDIL